MNLRELINSVFFKSKKYELVKNNLIYQHFSKSELKLDFDYVMAHRLMKTKDFFFIQVGANVGVSERDPIYTYIENKMITGICLEPIPFYFNELEQNYGNLENVRLVNQALHPTENELTMYKIEENAVGKNGVPKWARGISTFNKSIIDKHRKDIPNYEKLLVEEKVKCMSFKNLLTEHNVSKIDLLLIDTEGFDYEVIKMVDFKKIKPAIIKFEYKHLQKDDLLNCIELLSSNGYMSFFEDIDITAYLNE